MVKELFKLTKNSTNISFKIKGKYNKLRITRVIYTTASNNNYNIMVHLSGWENDHFFENYQFTKIFTCPRNTSVNLDYINNFDNLYDIETTIPKDISNHILTVLVNNDSSNTDINSGNPLFIEFEYI